MAMDRQGPLCFSCHPDLEKQLAESKSKHAPVSDGECTQCHNPHKAKLENLLLAKSPDLCQTCHKDLKMRVEEEKAHPPAVRDCQRCHKPHSSVQAALMNQPIQALCGECHDSKKATFGKAHLNIEAAVMNCRNCHDPHASKDPKFFKSVVHAPFAGRSCEECHIVTK
jgi:predicted CXXCH cytochrome family protein